MAHIRILMATWNGAAHLDAQLASIAAQDHGDWSLWASDDGSSDGTRDLLAGFAAAHPGREVRVLAGPGRGAAANFLSLIARAGAEGAGTDAHLALSDQDDVWLPDRLSRASGMLGGATDGGAALYSSRTVLIDAEGRALRVSRRHPRGLSFGNALVQNVMAGNTMVATPELARLLARAAPAARAAGVAHHDWWAYLLAAGTGARLVHDDRPSLFYRQHGANAMGASDGLRQAGSRLAMIARGDYAAWIAANLAALEAVPLEPEARALADRFQAWRRGEGSLAALRRAGVRRQGPAGDAVLAVLAATGRLRA